MSHQEDNNSNKDITRSWVTTSRFLFYIQLFCVVAMVLGGCYNLYSYRYKGKPKVEIPSSTLYNPTYKK